MKAVFVFCEGFHDVTFVVRSLGQVAGAKWVDDPIGKLPSPLGPVPDPANPSKAKAESLIAMRYSRHAIGESSLQAAARPLPPTFEAVLSTIDTLYVLVRCHGDSAAKSAIDLLQDVASLLDPEYGTDVREMGAAFLFDADSRGVEARVRSFAQLHQSLWQDGNAPEHAKWVRGTVGGIDLPVGLFVFHDPVTARGTLEDKVAPMVSSEWPGRWNAAGEFLKEQQEPTDPVALKPSEALKAQVCIVGQFRFPGSPMTQLLRRGGLPDRHFQGQAPRVLVEFLGGVPW